MKMKTLFWVLFVVIFYLVNALGLFFVLVQYGNFSMIAGLFLLKGQ
jgi:hypothetical protein